METIKFLFFTFIVLGFLQQESSAMMEGRSEGNANATTVRHGASDELINQGNHKAIEKWFSENSQKVNLSDFEKLPKDTKSRILFFLSGDDLIQIAHVSKILRQDAWHAAQSHVFKLKTTNLFPAILYLMMAGESILTNIKWGNIGSCPTHLCLYSAQIGNEEARYIGEGLKINTTIRYLDLRFNKISSEGTKYISDSLKINSSLIHLFLSNNQIEDEGVKYIFESLKVNFSLTQLFLTANHIGNEGAKYIGEGLKANSSLTQLFLTENQIGVEGAKYIGEGLKANSSLMQLNLACNHVGNEKRKSRQHVGQGFLGPIGSAIHFLENIEGGFQSIGSYFTFNQQKHVNEGLESICEALKVNVTLKNLNLSSNQIGVEGTRQICEAFKVNSTLTELYLGNNGVEEGEKKMLEESKRTGLMIEY